MRETFFQTVKSAILRGSGFGKNEAGQEPWNSHPIDSADRIRAQTLPKRNSSRVQTQQSKPAARKGQV